MSDKTTHSLHLNVLPNSGKVEQLRAEMATSPISPRATEKPSENPLVQKVIEMIREVYDPEIPVNIYELGLIYSIDVEADNTVLVKMTLTAPACPVAGTLPLEVERRIETIPEVKSAKVDIVWDPPWSRDRMSEAALLELGLL